MTTTVSSSSCSPLPPPLAAFLASLTQTFSFPYRGGVVSLEENQARSSNRRRSSVYPSTAAGTSTVQIPPFFFFLLQLLSLFEKMLTLLPFFLLPSLVLGVVSSWLRVSVSPRFRVRAPHHHQVVDKQEQTKNLSVSVRACGGGTALPPSLAPSRPAYVHETRTETHGQRRSIKEKEKSSPTPVGVRQRGH